MRGFPLLFSCFLLVPSLAWADDAGVDDAGLDDGGSDAASPTADAGEVPDANPPDDTDERCLDGYDRSYVDACAGKTAGAVCTFAGGESGQCAALRCLTPSGDPYLTCAATTGMTPPPPSLEDAGLAPADAGETSATPDAGGGGCDVGSSAPGAWSLLGLAALAALTSRRLRS